MLNQHFRSIHHRRASAAVPAGPEGSRVHAIGDIHGRAHPLEPERHPNRIAIDTGAFVTGHLTALVLDGKSRRFMST